MILTWTEQEENDYIPLQWGLYGTFIADTPVTLEDILKCCLANNALLVEIAARQQGFRREKPTRKEIHDLQIIVLNEIRDMKKEIRRRKVNKGR